MRADRETDAEGCELILELAAHLERRIGNLDLEQFLADKDEIDLTAYRLAVIGETTNKFTDELKLRHCEINWRAIYGMRNYLVHGYAHLDEKSIWTAVRYSLPALKAVCIFELNALQP